MSILKNVEILCKKYVDDHPDSLCDAKRRCFAHLLKKMKKKKKRIENDTSDKLLAIQIEMRTRGEAEKADELESLLGRIDHTAVLEMLLLLRMKKRNDDRILVSSENKKLRKFFREPSEATYSSPKRHSQLSSFFSPSSESKKRTNLFGALNVSKLVPRSKPVRSLNLKLSIPVLVSVRDANVVKRAERKSERHRKYKNNDGKERKKKKSKKSKKKESKSETSDCKENIWTIVTNKHYEKKKYWEDDITPSESHSILVSSASQFSTFHRKEFQSMFESQSKVVKLREIILDSYKCLQGIPSTTFTYVCLLLYKKLLPFNSHNHPKQQQIQQRLETIRNRHDIASLHNYKDKSSLDSLTDQYVRYICTYAVAFRTTFRDCLFRWTHCTGIRFGCT